MRPSPASTRRGPVPDRDAARRAQLLDAGLDAFGTEGYAASAIEAICAAARVGTRSFYRYFTSKEDLLQAVYDRQIAHVAGAVTTALERHADEGVVARVRAGAEAFVHASTSDLRATRVQLVEIVGVSERLEEHRRGVLKAFAVLVEQEYHDLAERGVIPVPLPPVICTALVGGSTEVLVDWLYSDAPPSRAEIVDGLVMLYVNAAT